MEEIDEDGKKMIYLNMEEADYFVSKCRSVMSLSRKTVWLYAFAAGAMLLVVTFNIALVLYGNMASIGPLALCVFWAGFLAYRAVDRWVAARKMRIILDGLLTRIGDHEIRRALEDGGHDDE
jgi:hypothetical protein